MLLGSGTTAQSVAKHDELKLYEAAVRYIIAGEMSYAAECLWRITRRDIHILYNRALCYFAAGNFRECFNLLTEAEAMLSQDPATQRCAPDTVLQWEYRSDFHLSPMMEDAPECIKALQILRMKAECSAKLGLDSELNDINAALNCRYRHINNLIGRNEDEDHGNRGSSACLH